MKINGKQYLHLVKAIQGNDIKSGTIEAGINGWVSENSIFGKCMRVE